MYGYFIYCCTNLTSLHERFSFSDWIADSDLLSRMPPVVPAPSPKAALAPPRARHEPVLPTEFRARFSEIVRVHYPGAAWGRFPILAAAFPRFTYPDVNFWIWAFGWRYRRLVAAWADQITSYGPKAERSWRDLGKPAEKPTPRNQRKGPSRNRAPQLQANLAELALSAYYSAVRRALLVTVVLRGLGAAFLSGASVWLLLRRWARLRQGLPGWGLDQVLT